MNSPVVAKALTAAAVLVCLGVAVLTALLGVRRLDGHWDWLAVISVAGVALVAVGLIRLILAAVDNWIEHASLRRGDPDGGYPP